MVHPAQQAAMSPFPHMIIFGEWLWHAMKCLWEGHGNMGTTREWHWEQGNYTGTLWEHYGNAMWIYEGKVVCCFVLFVLMRSTELGCFRSCSWSLWKALNKEGASAFGFMAFGLAGCRSSWILNDFFTENLGGTGMCLWCVVGKILMRRFNGNSFGKIWIQNVGDTGFLSDFWCWELE